VQPAQAGFAKVASPTQGNRLRGIRGKGALLETIQYESVSEAEVEVILQRALGGHLRFGLPAQGQSLSVVRSHVARNLNSLDCFALAFKIYFFGDVHRGGIIEGRMRQ
jgi:hypothetical protein